MSELTAGADAVLLALADQKRKVDPGAGVPLLRIAAAASLSVEECSKAVTDLAQRGLVAIVGAALGPGLSVDLTAAGRDAANALGVLPAEGPVAHFAAGLDELQRAVLDTVAEWELRVAGGATSRSHVRTQVRKTINPKPDIDTATGAIEALIGVHLEASGGEEPSYRVTLSGLLASRWGDNALRLIGGTLAHLREWKNDDPSLSRYSWSRLRTALGLPDAALNLAYLSITRAKLGRGLFETEGDRWWSTPPEIDRLLEPQSALDYVQGVVRSGPSTPARTQHRPLPQGDTAIYLAKLRVTNVKLLADQEFGFLNDDGTVRKWTVLIGDNGVCKSTLLQLVALAASGEKLARALVEDAADYRCAADASRGGSFEANFIVTRGAIPDDVERDTLDVQMLIEQGRVDFVGAKDTAVVDDVRGRRHPGLFVVGYGVGRHLPRPGEVAVPRDPALDRVEGLFTAHHKMLGIDFYEALQKEGLANEFSKTLRDVLLAEDDGERLLPFLSSLELRGRGGLEKMRQLLESRRFEVHVGNTVMKLAPGALSQGYQSMVSWICDLLGHAFLEFGDRADPATLRGLVLLDEIDLHLHPTWQRRLVPVLRHTFPELQFIVTTHSPLVLTGFDQNEIVWLDLDGDRVVQRPPPFEPGALRGSELLGSFFDVPRAGRPSLVRKERRYLELKASTERTPEEDREIAELESSLARYWLSTPGEIDEEDGQ